MEEKKVEIWKREMEIGEAGCRALKSVFPEKQNSQRSVTQFYFIFDKNSVTQLLGGMFDKRIFLVIYEWATL